MENSADDDASVAKLFFDSFSKKVGAVEDGLRRMTKDVESLHLSMERSQISDLVLLERLQKAEATLEESLGWIKRVADKATETSPLTAPRATEIVQDRGITLPELTASVPSPAPFQGIAAPWGQSTSLPSITTSTELQVLSLLSEQGPKSAPEVGRLLGRSREHSARLMKKLYQEGYVNRDQSRIPFRYSAVERVKASFKRSEKKEEERQEAAAAA